MSRPDLLALTPEALASFANMGLVKRAQREIAAGEGPAIEEDPAGIVIGRFKDGVVTRLVPGSVLKDCPCTCGASMACRHRVATALAYPAWAASQSPRVPEAVTPPTTSEAPWSPADFTDELLGEALGTRTLDRARAIVRAGLLVEVRPSGVEPIPSAQLPTCTVRFLVPRDLTYARCDCVIATRCEHVAVAVWAFRESVRPGESPRTRTIELGHSTERQSTGLDEAVALAGEVLVTGVANVQPEIAQRFGRCRAALQASDALWPLAAVDALEQLLEAYRQRSTRYSPTAVAENIAELAARARATARGGELPTRFILGADEPAETLLDHLRLVSLGARVTADDRRRDAEVYLADPDSGTILVAQKTWMPDDTREPEDAIALARRIFGAKATLGALAHGQVVSKAVKRSANRSVAISAARAGQTSVTPQRGDWELLPPSLLIRDLQVYAEERRRQPPRLLRPRLLAESLRVVAIKRVGVVAYLPAEQTFTAELYDAQDNVVHATLRHRSVAPHAVDAFAAAVAGPLRYVSGELRVGPHGLEIEPVAVVTDRMIVPDLAPDPQAWTAPHVVRRAVTSPLEAAVDTATGTLHEAAHAGLAHLRPDWSARVRATAAQLEELGLVALSKRLSALDDRVQLLRNGGAHEDAAGAWLDAAIRAELVRASL